jgi:hypothetical protein
MTPRLSTVSAEKILEILRAHGFEVARQRVNQPSSAASSSSAQPTRGRS